MPEGSSEMLKEKQKEKLVPTQEKRGEYHRQNSRRKRACTREREEEKTEEEKKDLMGSQIREIGGRREGRSSKEQSRGFVSNLERERL